MIRELKEALKYLRHMRRMKKEGVQMEKVKSGIKTSEFWVALCGAIIPVLNQHLGLNIPQEVVMTILGLMASYIIGRLIVKKGA